MVLHLTDVIDCTLYSGPMLSISYVALSTCSNTLNEAFCYLVGLDGQLGDLSILNGPCLITLLHDKSNTEKNLHHTKYIIL